MRHSGKLLRLGIGRPYAHHPVLILIAGNDTITIDRTTGEIIAEHTIDPTHLPAQKTHQRHYTCQQRRDTPVNNDVTHPHTKRPGHRQQTVNNVPTHHSGRPRGNRTPNPQIKSPMLCQLS